jgi:hypothetical protein
MHLGVEQASTVTETGELREDSEKVQLALWGKRRLKHRGINQSPCLAHGGIAECTPTAGEGVFLLRLGPEWAVFQKLGGADEVFVGVLTRGLREELGEDGFFLHGILNAESG